MPEPPERNRWNWTALIGVAAALVFMSWLSWRKWPDLLIDFGQQLYIPWRIASGAVLYRDIAYLPGGPLSQYFNGALFRLFGPSLNVLITANYALSVLLLWLVYRLFRRAADQLTAVMVVLTIIFGFAFAQYVEIGNYNYICPYSHEITHGLLLSVVMLHFIVRYLGDRKQTDICTAGLCFGAIFLTKPEMFLAAGAVALASGILSTANSSASQLSTLNSQPHCSASRRLLHGLVLFVGSALIIPAVFLLLFIRTETLHDSLRYICWAWVPLLTSKVGTSAFYLQKLGLDSPLPHLSWMLAYSAGFSAFLGLCAWRLRPETKSFEKIVLFSIAGAIPLLTSWLECGQALPLVTIAGVAMLVWGSRKQLLSRTQFAVALLWFVFAMFLLLKMGLAPRISHYGFVLAMPAFGGGIYLLLWLMPAMLKDSRTDPRLFRAAMLVLISVGLFRFVAQSAVAYREKDFPLGAPQDRIVAPDPKVEFSTAAFNAALSWVEKNTTPSQTVAVLPEGVMLNYLARRVNPTPYLVFMAEVSAFGEERMSAAYRAHPPDFILLMHRDSSEYGLPYFGQQKGYGLQMVQWIEQNYQPVLLIGHAPLETNKFGIRIFRRKT